MTILPLAAGVPQTLVYIFTTISAISFETLTVVMTVSIKTRAAFPTGFLITFVKVYTFKTFLLDVSPPPELRTKFSVFVINSTNLTQSN